MPPWQIQVIPDLVSIGSAGATPLESESEPRAVTEQVFSLYSQDCFYLNSLNLMNGSLSSQLSVFSTIGQSISTIWYLLCLRWPLFCIFYKHLHFQIIKNLISMMIKNTQFFISFNLIGLVLQPYRKASWFCCMMYSNYSTVHIFLFPEGKKDIGRSLQARCHFFVCYTSSSHFSSEVRKIITCPVI